MEDRLLPINGLLGLVLPYGIDKPLLKESGYELAGLEVPVTTATGKVVIDVLLFNRDRSLLLACEAKSGANVEAPQAAKYRLLDAQGIVLAGNITLSSPIQPSVVAVYACLCQHIDRIRLGLNEVNLHSPIVGVCHEHITFDLSDQVPEPVLRTFPVRSLPLNGPPPSLIQFDHESSVADVTPAVRAQLVKALAVPKQQVTVRWLAEEAAPYLAFYARTAQQRLVRTVGEAARQIAQSDTATFEYHPPPPNDPNCGFVRFLRTPEDNDPRGRTQAYQALARSSQLRRKRTRQHDPDQLDLLQELLQADDEDTIEAGEEEEP
ncbi:hypothetical protein [Actinophytocola oryzae]|uniref:PD-(D/E)XK nuclease superfamily protein n=1 Tax=Actinophytocola oryzae TaxID=502181 RepID=A0A4R7VSI1_9PSEU|nr:hypothetical protein [Actinophytocola oryzae]TDV52455.1 hypothetical protein CLV71_105587 [Actinophytocola oryzae]